MAEEPKDAAEAGKEPKKEGAEAGAAPAETPQKKGGVLYIGLGGGAMAVIALAYFLTVAAVETGAQIPQVTEHAETAAPEETKADEHKEAPEEKKDGHGETEAKEAEAGGHGGEQGEGDKAQPKGTGDPNRQFVELDKFQTNLAKAGQQRFFNGQFGIVIEGPDAQASAIKVQQELEIKNAIRDALNRLFRTKTVDDMEGENNFFYIKREITEIVNKIAFPKGEARVADVFALEFIVQ